MKKVIALLIIIMLLSACQTKQKEVETPVPAPKPEKPAVEEQIEKEIPPAEEAAASNLFDARKLKTGDLVSGLKVAKSEVSNANYEDYDAYVDFEGEVTVSGTFKHNLDDEFLDHEISFIVDKQSAAILPKLAHDQRYVWFMFMNHDEAEKALGVPGSEGNATVTIKNYSINYAHTEIWNTAELVRVEE